MSYTYSQILDRMNNKFTELSGYSPENASDASIKMKLLAGELYSLCTEIDRIKLQIPAERICRCSGIFSLED